MHDAHQPAHADGPGGVGRVRLRPGHRVRIACFGPLGLGLLREATGSWSVPLVVLAATAVPGVVAGWFACRPRFVDDAVVVADRPADDVEDRAAGA